VNEHTDRTPNTDEYWWAGVTQNAAKHLGEQPLTLAEGLTQHESAMVLLHELSGNHMLHQIAGLIAAECRAAERRSRESSDDTDHEMAAWYDKLARVFERAALDASILELSGHVDN